MKIGLVLSNSPAQSETFFTSKIKGLQDRGHQVVLFANQTKGFHLCRFIIHPKVSRNSILQFARMIISYSVLFIKRPIIFIRFLRLEKMDGVPIISRWENLYLNYHILKENLDWLHFGFATMTLRRENVAQAIDAKMGVSLRGYDICIYPLKYPECYQRVWDKVDKIHSISYDLLEAAEEHGLTKKIPQVLIQPATNIAFFKAGEKKWKKFDGKEKIHFLTVARLHWKKGLEYTIQALAMLKEKNILFQYTIIGKGQERERLIFAVHQLRMDDQVVFSGTVPHQDIRKYYEEADIYLQYSIQEGFCNSVLEAQAMGLITIVSDAEGLPENVIDDETGWVVPKRSPKLLTEKIENVLTMPDEKLNQVHKNSMARVKKEFNLEKQSQEFYSFFN
jgi:colanic acid/amylovoran biosynthesis glycosyltransferase